VSVAPIIRFPFSLAISKWPRPSTRCPWANGSDLYAAYHDDEWGVPVHDDGRFFEFLILEGAQAGLSWSTILNKRDAYREAFAGFDPAVSPASTTAESSADVERRASSATD
jgi:DNA-3-methyladenine glycosylase I